MSEHERLDRPGLFACGTPPKLGERVWLRDREWIVMADGVTLTPVAPDAHFRPSVGERIVAALMCPACLLPRFVPGHIRGCSR